MKATILCAWLAIAAVQVCLFIPDMPDGLFRPSIIFV